LQEGDDDAEKRSGSSTARDSNGELARVVFAAAIAKKPAGRFMIRNRTRVVKRHPQGDW
jgi:hypothetical protein